MKPNFTLLNKQVSFKTINLCLALLFGNILAAQNVDYAWAKNFGGSANDYGNSITTDAAGNVYTTGSFVSTADFDPSSGTSNLVSNGSFDIFISKLDASGNFVWAKGIGGTSTDYGSYVSIDATGNVYVTGRFNGTVDFDPGTGVSNLVSNGSFDNYILKLSATGDFLWAKSFGGASPDEISAAHFDQAGNVYTTGTFAGTVDFDPGSGTSNLTSINGGNDIFISKLDAAGNFVWAKSFGGTSVDQGYDLKLDAAGNIFITGVFRNTVDFDPGAGVTNLSSVNGYWDVFVSKLDASGNFVWAKGFGGTGNDIGRSIALDNTGNIYITGEFSETADFNPGTAINNLTAIDGVDAFVSKLDASGNFVWIRQLGGTDIDKSYCIATDAIGNVYVTGEFRGTIDLDPGKGVKNFNSAGFSDIFITKLSPTGNYLWARRYGANIDDKGYSIHIDGSGNVYATGLFMVSVYFSPLGVVPDYVTTKGGMDAFVVKLGCTPTTSIKEVTACNKYVFNGKTYTSDNITATDTFTNSVGCDSVITLNLTINTLDVSTTQTGNTLTANLVGAEYQWINCNKGNGAISGAISSSYTPSIDGSYAVIINFKGCSDTSDCVTIGAMSINSKTQANNTYQLYPNPTKNKVTIANFQNSINKIAIIDISGKVLESFVPANSEIDLRRLRNGIYFIRIQDGNQFTIHKVIKN